MILFFLRIEYHNHPPFSRTKKSGDGSLFDITQLVVSAAGRGFFYAKSSGKNSEADIYHIMFMF